MKLLSRLFRKKTVESWPPYLGNFEPTVLVGGQKLLAHSQATCIPVDGHCAIHNPSDHVLSGRPQNWRSDRSLMERICVHGVGHPDPDDMAWAEAHLSPEEVDGRGLHGSCGPDWCCCWERPAEVAAL